MNIPIDEQSALEGHGRLMAELRSLSPPSAILDAFEEVPRHRFLPGVPLEEVYRDGFVTTVREAGLAVSSCSQPSWVVRVISHAGVATGQRVLEIGSGTGYSSAILARVVGPSGSVVTLDIDQNLVDMTRTNLAAFGFERENELEHVVRFRKPGFGVITTLCQDGFLPTPNSTALERHRMNAATPIEPVYHAIMVTALCTDIAPCWHHQLAEGGHLVLPLALLPGFSILVAFVKRVDRLVSRHIEFSKAVALRGEGAKDSANWRELQIEAFLNTEADATDKMVLQRRHNQLVLGPAKRP